jgi:hypothetical protein
VTKHKRGRPKKHESGGQISIWFDEETKGMIERLKKKRNMNESLSDVTNYLIQVGLGSFEGIEPHYKETQESFDDLPRRKSISKSLRFEVFKRDSFTCQYCGRKAPEVTLHVDHVVPVSKGGQNDISNLVTACQDCNLGKGARPLNTHTIGEKDERREQIKMLMTCQSDLLKMLSMTLDK